MPRRIGPGGSPATAEQDPQQQPQTEKVEVAAKVEPPRAAPPGEARIAQLEEKVATLHGEKVALLEQLRRLVELVQPVEQVAIVADQVRLPDHVGLILLRDKPAQLVIGDCRKLREFLLRERAKATAAAHPWAGQDP